MENKEMIRLGSGNCISKENLKKSYEACDGKEVVLKHDGKVVGKTKLSFKNDKIIGISKINDKKIQDMIKRGLLGSVSMGCNTLDGEVCVDFVDEEKIKTIKGL